jgi:hypothetical protein
MVCHQENFVNIWREHNLGSRRQSRGYGVDDLAFSMKAAVADWAYKNTRTPVSDVSSDLQAFHVHLADNLTVRDRLLHR